uniref:Cytochrome P450, family 2, subfamily N, polypeptide 13 n=1 Tax=Electrophorus electricus TaxID=8005 RepID=A0AAY5EWV1_ELEEL
FAGESAEEKGLGRSRWLHATALFLVVVVPLGPPWPGLNRLRPPPRNSWGCSPLPPEKTQTTKTFYPSNLCLQMSKQYGSIFTVYFGPKKVVVLTGYQTVKQALVNHAEEFGDKRHHPVSNCGPGLMISVYDQGILFSNGENWKEMRRFALSTLQDFGQGKRGSEERIIEEMWNLREVVENFKGKRHKYIFSILLLPEVTIFSIVYGSRFEYSDPRFQNMVNRSNENIRITGSASIQLYNMFPWLRLWLKDWKIIMANCEKTLKDIMQLVHSLQETLNPQECRGFIDCFLACKQNVEAGKKNSLFHAQNLLQTVSNLFAYPHIQDQVQQEIDRVVGGRQPVLDDHKNLPYTDAVIHETQRLADIVPMSLPHTTTCDINFQGFFIKKGTCVFALLTSVLKDENEWESPYTFNPGHFLDEVCLGESLARMELFLFFATLLQHFRFTPPPGVSEEQLDLMPAVGFTLTPLPISSAQ